MSRPAGGPVRFLLILHHLGFQCLFNPGICHWILEMSGISGRNDTDEGEEEEGIVVVGGGYR